MKSIRKILFPYALNVSMNQRGSRVAVFFGADFYNLPLDSNRERFIERTNQILEYIRVCLPGHTLIYQPHPNETDEYTRLHLEGFTVEKHSIAELYLYKHADTIDYVFSAQSGASISAYAMGFDSVVFLDLLHGALSEDSIIGYRSYFSGLPDSFFIKSFNQPLPRREPTPVGAEEDSLREIHQTINPQGSLWILASDPSVGLRGAILVRQLRASLPHLKAHLLVINHRRWSLGLKNPIIQNAFDEVLILPGPRVWYGVRLGRLISAIKSAYFLKQLPLREGDTLISCNHALFEENCLLSYHPRVKHILLIENRWYQFIYGGGHTMLHARKFRSSWGVLFFHYFLEPLLGLHRTLYQEYSDGKVLNILRYTLPLEDVYDTVFVTDYP